MDGNLVSLVAVVLSLGIPMAGMYCYYRIRKLRSEERLAAIAKGVSVPMEPELSQPARSRRAAILLISGAIGIIVAFGLIAQIEHEPETWTAAALAVIPLAIGIGYLLDFTLLGRDLQS
jgi:hypothetical protein